MPTKRKSKHNKKLTKAEKEIQEHERAMLALKKINAPDAVEALGFAGLVYANYVGIDIFGMVLGQASAFALDVVAEVAGEVGKVGFTDILAGVSSGNPIQLTQTVIEQLTLATGGKQRIAVEQALEKEGLKISQEQARLEAEIERIQSVGPLSPAEQAAVDNKRAQIKALTPTTKAEKQKQTERIIAEVNYEQLLISVGMAYAEKKFLESYNVFKAIENLPLP